MATCNQPFGRILESEYQALDKAVVESKSHVTANVFMQLKRKWRGPNTRPDFLNKNELKQCGISSRAYSDALKALQVTGLIRQTGEVLIGGYRARLWRFPHEDRQQGDSRPVEVTEGSNKAIVAVSGAIVAPLDEKQGDSRPEQGGNRLPLRSEDSEKEEIQDAAIDPIRTSRQQTGEAQQQSTSDPVFNPATGMFEYQDGSIITSESDCAYFIKQHTEICQKGCGQQVHPARLSNGQWSTVDPDTHKLHKCKQEHILSYQERLKIKSKLLEYKRAGWIEMLDGSKRQWISFTLEVYNRPLKDRHPWHDIFAEIEGWHRPNRKLSTRVKQSSDIGGDDQSNGESPEMEEEPH